MFTNTVKDSLHPLLLIGGFLCFFLSSQKSQAQFYDHAIGLRAGTSFELSYKRFLFYSPGVQQAIEGLIGFQLDEKNKRQNGYVLEALYHVHMDLGFDTGFSGFVAGGGYLGLYSEIGLDKPFLGGGFTAAIGASYTFTHTPINVALDWKPIIGYPRISLSRGAITLRYIFPTTWQ